MSFSVHVCLPPDKMTLIGHARLADGLTRKKINLDHARMELRDLCEIHAERPHCFQRRVDDDFLFGPERWLQLMPPNQRAAYPAKPCRSRAAARPPQDETDPWRLARLECRKKEASLAFTLSILQTIFDATLLEDCRRPREASIHANQLRSESLRV